MPQSPKNGVKFCTGCGAPIDQVVRLRFCPYCGSADEGKKFCAECGASLQSLPTASQAAAASGSTAGAQTSVSGQETPVARLAKAYCPDCGNEATWVSTYSQWYCYTDQKYVAAPSFTEPKKGLLKKK